MFSVIIPAYNEGNVIGRCLRSMTENAEPGEMEIIVVCNGCKDDTAEVARSFGDPVKVVETEIPSKYQALNLGDEAATCFPRIYVDADIELSPNALRDVAAMLTDGSPVLAAAPRVHIDCRNRSFLVKSFFKVWTSLPYFKEGVTGGFYGLSRAGRARFDKFPDIIADDEYVRLSVKPGERKCATNSTFTITPPTTLRGIVNIYTRARAGCYELRSRFPELWANQTTSPGRSLRVIALTPSLWVHAPIYLGVMFCAKLRAHRKLWLKQEKQWERDETSRS